MRERQPNRHTLHALHHHWCWNNQLAPALEVAPGDNISITTLESSGGQIGPASSVEDVAQMDFSRVNPVTGPIFIDGAEPGDVVTITINDMAPSGIGWTAVIPEFGLLADQFEKPALKLWRYETHRSADARYSDVARVFIQPMLGAVGLAPAAPGDHDILPPRRVGGTLDIRDIGPGSTLFLPVEVEGGLLSVGDTHAAQGDGEVCGTGLESAIDIDITLGLRKQEPLCSPRVDIDNRVVRTLDSCGFHVTTAIGEDLMQGARDAVSAMIELLMGEHGLGAEDAYMLCSLCADLRISEIVNRPNYVVSFYFPRIVFE